MAAVFIQKDNQIYDEFRDVVAASAVVKGEPVVRQDTFGFYHNAVTAADITEDRDDVIIIYRCRQVEATKKTGSGEGITSGDKIYFYVATDNVSATATGTAGTDYYFCGWAKETASTSATTVLMNFDGTRHTEDI